MAKKKLTVKGYETFSNSHELINWQIQNSNCTITSIMPLASNIQFTTDVSDCDVSQANLKTDISVFVIFEKVIDL